VPAVVSVAVSADVPAAAPDNIPGLSVQEDVAPQVP